MELAVIFGLVIAIAILASIPARRYERRTGKKLGRSGSAVGLGVVQELFQPSAANAAVVLEEQREARQAIPAPGDPINDRGAVVTIEVDVPSSRG